MNIREYVEKAIHLSEVPFSNNTPIEQAAMLTIRSGFPTPHYGVDLIGSHRGDTNNGIDWALSHLRNFVEELIEHVVEECVQTIQTQPDLTSDSRQAAIAALRKHFEIVVH